MCGKSSNTTTNSSTPSAEQLDAYRYVTNVAQTAASLPLQQYSGPRVAGFTPDQEAAFSAVENAQGIGTPYLNTASQYAAQGAAPVSPTAFSADEVAKYFNPYKDSVIDSTLANIRQSDALAQNDLLGKAISSGASPFGGDRAGIAAAELARNQSLARNQTISQLESDAYNKALDTFGQQQAIDLGARQNDATRAAAAAEQYAGLGSQAQNQALTGASALLQTGNLQQQLAQQQLDVPYQEFQEQQQYPRDVANWLINAINGNPTSLGSTTTTTSPGTNSLTGILGALTSLGSLFLKKGGPVKDYDSGGGVQDDRFDWSAPSGYGIDIPMLRESVFRVSPTAQAINWSGGGTTTPVTTIPSYINALPQISLDAMPAARTYELPSGLLAAIKAVPESLQPKKAGGGIGFALGGDITDIEYDPAPLGEITPVVATGLEPVTPSMPAAGHQAPASGQSVIPTNEGAGIAAARKPQTSDTSDASDTPDASVASDGVDRPGSGLGALLEKVTGPGFLNSPRSALFDAGIGMMASTSPNLLTGIGEGLAAGVGAWEKRKAAAAELDAHPVIDDSGPTIRVYYPSEKTWTDTGIPTTKSQELQLKRDMLEKGYRPATPEERKAYGVDAKVPLVFGPDGKPTTLGAPSTVIDMKGETKFAETYGGKQAEAASEIAPAAAKAGSELQKSSLLGKLLDQVETGPLAPTVANVGAWMQSVGVDPSIIGIDPKTPATLQAISGLTNQMIMGKIGPGGFPANNFSEQDRKFILTTIPQMSDLPGAIRIKLAVSDRLNQLAVEKANAWDVAQDEANKSGIPVDEAYRNFERDWRTRMEGMNLFGDLAEQAGQVQPPESGPRGASAPAPSPAPVGSSKPPQVTNDADYDALPSGSMFVDPNGTLRRKP